MLMQDTQTAAEKAIRLLLAAHGRTNAWLAEQLGVSPFTLSRRMRGEIKFDVELLDRIATLFGLTFEQLLATADAVAVNQ